MPIVIKRDCTEDQFDKNKIYNAIYNSMKYGSGIVKEKIAENIANEIEEEIKDLDEISIYDIEDKVIAKLKAKKQKLTADAYYKYKTLQTLRRETKNTIDKEIQELLGGDSEYCPECYICENYKKRENEIKTIPYENRRNFEEEIWIEMLKGKINEKNIK